MTRDEKRVDQTNKESVYRVVWHVEAEPTSLWAAIENRKRKRLTITLLQPESLVRTHDGMTFSTYLPTTLPGGA